jgi:hypothetical protein
MIRLYRAVHPIQHRDSRGFTTYSAVQMSQRCVRLFAARVAPPANSTPRSRNWPEGADCRPRGPHLELETKERTRISTPRVFDFAQSRSAVSCTGEVPHVRSPVTLVQCPLSCKLKRAQLRLWTRRATPRNQRQSAAGPVQSVPSRRMRVFDFAVQTQKPLPGLSGVSAGQAEVLERAHPRPPLLCQLLLPCRTRAVCSGQARRVHRGESRRLHTMCIG